MSRAHWADLGETTFVGGTWFLYAVYRILGRLPFRICLYPVVFCWWLGSGPARRASLDLLRDSADLGLPRVAIGGITADNAPSLVAAGADLVAVISGVFDAADPVAAARAYHSCFDTGIPGTPSE